MEMSERRKGRRKSEPGGRVEWEDGVRSRCKLGFVHGRPILICNREGSVPIQADLLTRKGKHSFSEKSGKDGSRRNFGPTETN